MSETVECLGIWCFPQNMNYCEPIKRVTKSFLLSEEILLTYLLKKNQETKSQYNWVQQIV